MSRPTAIDVFSGCGGLSHGLRLAGFNVIGAVDNSALSVWTYRLNHRRTYVWEKDISDLTIAEVKRKLNLKIGELDLLAGCPPCQAFSAMRTRNGKHCINDASKNLVYEVVRLVRGLRPKTIMVENVPGLAADRRIVNFCSKLASLGYQCEYRVLNVANYGVPQRRRRMILLASRLGPPEFAPPTNKRRTVRDAIGSLSSANRSGDPLHTSSEARSPRITRLIYKIPRNGGSRKHLGKRGQLSCHTDFDGFKDVYGRMAWDAVAPTITSGCVNPSKGRFLHPKANRAITLREAALLQGFPASYRLSLDYGKFAAAGLIGNALPPEFVRRHAVWVKGHLALF
jgi:DNA (cytosine-5)-methyltransferase 1